MNDGISGVGKKPDVMLVEDYEPKLAPSAQQTLADAVEAQNRPPEILSPHGAGQVPKAGKDLDVPATARILMGITGKPERPRFVGRIERSDTGVAWAIDIIKKTRVPLARGQDVPESGTVANIQLVQQGDKWVARIDGDPLAAANSARAHMYDIAARHKLDPTFSPAIMGEVDAILANPGIDSDRSLVDLTQLPFITIDNPSSRDLDQAMYIERNGDGFEVYYALADAAYYIKPGMALFDEGMKRSTSSYLPGLTVPMLPKQLSEDVISLNPHVNRRAMVLKMSVGADGKVTNTDFLRARINSRDKLTYGGVQALHDNPTTSPLRNKPYTETLELLREVGEIRMADAIERDVVRYNRSSVKVKIGEGGDATYSLVADTRYETEKWNEQVSLMCNIEGAKLLLHDGAELPNLQGIFRVHDRPPPERMEQFEEFINHMVGALELNPEVWSWRRAEGESLADYLLHLPTEGDAGRVANAIQRRAMFTNNPAEFHEEPGFHYGIGAQAYARFSSPMREMVGIFTHKEAWELLEGHAGHTPFYDDEALRDRIIGGGNQAKKTQNRITKEANKLAIDALFDSDLEMPADVRPLRRGTVMGLTRKRVYVLLDDPPIEVKVYLNELDPGGNRYRLDESGVTMRGPGGGFSVGGALDIRIGGYDQVAHHWIIEPVPVGRSR